MWPPIALVITLLVTDPATQPKTPVGRLLFGLLAGVLMRVCGDLLQTYLNRTSGQGRRCGAGQLLVCAVDRCCGGQIAKARQ